MPRKRAKSGLPIAAGLLLLLATGQTVQAWATPATDPADTCEGKPTGSNCWMELENHPERFVWNTFLRDNQYVTWSGECSGGLAQGAGTDTWGHDVDRERTTVGEGAYVDGKRNGKWTIRESSNAVTEGAYLNGTRIGTWVTRFENGGTQEGAYLDGERTGMWVQHSSNGDELKGSYSLGKRNGRWELRRRNDEVHELHFVNGVQLR